uniref:Uncharacterized protein n=1 Tax=Coccolithus braarudii TaxID=221442 RepID=A0A7S0L8Q6_9EUKA|mmetsp:Transcript_26742/g.57763  ORF Transcript_26742/g.57763 Transcript_26742/m.57763 type:complete len:117 (+) Transcript_26742:231-581(+)
MQITAAVCELEMDYDSTVYGNIMAGARVIKAHHTDLSPYIPDNNGKVRARWYIPNPAEVIVPVELVLAASFEMEPAELPPRGASTLQRQAVALGALVLPEAAHEASITELKLRHGA